MIDTITLSLSENMYKLYEPNMFRLTTSQKGVSKWVLNGTKDERTRGVYYPMLTTVERVNSTGWTDKTLQIQVSLPKMMFGNNFDELAELDLPLVLDKLVLYLGRRGIKTSQDQLRRADVIGIHCGKNMVLQDGTTPQMIIEKVSQGEYTRRWDVEEVKYRNNGLGWKLHTNRWELALYDKKKDLQRANISEGRSEEQGNRVQLGLFDVPKKYKPFEVLRLEVRLNNKTMIKGVFKQIGITIPLTLESMFSETVTKKVLLHYVSLIENARPAFFDYQFGSKIDLLAELRVNKPSTSPTTLLAVACLKQAVDQGATLGEIREIVAPESNVQWRKLVKEAKLIPTPHVEQSLAILRSQIEGYRPLRLVDFKDKLINNDKRIIL